MLLFERVVEMKLFNTGRKMSKGAAYSELGDMCFRMLEERYDVMNESIGADEHKKAKGMAFTTVCSRVGEIGHLCIVRMKGFFGLMKMETVVFTVTGRDAPLINLDRVSAFGRDTMMIEMYDDQLTAYPEEYLQAFAELKSRDADIPDGNSGEHWYDSITYPCSYHKKAKGQNERFLAAAHDYFAEYLDQLEKAPACDRAEKEKKAGSFAQRLLKEGGPAVDQVTKLFGSDFAERLVLKYMYGVRRTLS